MKRVTHTGQPDKQTSEIEKNKILTQTRLLCLFVGEASGYEPPTSDDSKLISSIYIANMSTYIRFQR